MENGGMILVSACLTVSVAVIAIIVNRIVNQRNRNISTVMQLTKDFYQDSQFTRDRLKLWGKLEKLPDSDFDYKKFLEWVQNDQTSLIKIDEVVALNRTAAFYHAVGALIDRREVDMNLLKHFFGYNYNRFWNPYRKKFVENSTISLDQAFFKPIKELEQKLTN